MSNNSVIPQNRIKRALQAGQPVIGTMIVELRQPAVMQLLANAGFDFVIIDNEHGAFTVETIGELSWAARHVDLTPLVRVPDLTYPHVAQSLDAGAQGVMIPRITDVDQVRQALQMMKYPPVGIRGCALSRGYTDFKSGSVPEAMAAANKETMLIIQVETQQALEKIEEIVAVPGVDVTLIGPTDLSIALGVPGQIDHPRVQAGIETMVAACQRHNVVPAIHMNNLELAVYWAQHGMRLISSRAEIDLLVKGGLEVTSTIGQALGR